MVNINGNDDPNILIGTTGDDVINGLGGDDVLLGLAGADQLFGGRGNDLFQGGAGHDVITGGTGSDTVDYGDKTIDFQIFLDVGQADVKGSAGFEDRLFSIENARGGSGNDVIIGNLLGNTLFGGNGDDNIQAGAGNDRIYGGAGNDGMNPGSLEGGAGNDTIFGGSGNDFLSGDDIAHPEVIGTDKLDGGSGNDQLTGGPGADLLTGGTGNDTYVFAPGSGEDRVIGFIAGSGSPDDVLNVVDYGITGFGGLTITQQAAGAHVAFDSGDGVLLVGVSAADLAAQDFGFA